MLKKVFYILSIFTLLIIPFKTKAECECGGRYICDEKNKRWYFRESFVFYPEENTKIQGLALINRRCPSNEDLGARRACYVLYYKYDKEWIPVSISCTSRNDFIYKGYIEDIVKVKVKDKYGHISIKEVITNQKRIRMEAEEKVWFGAEHNYKDINVNGYGIYYSLDELKKAGYTIIEILDKKKEREKNSGE